MAYTLEEQLNNDFDILLFDGIKLIHIATAGGLLPPKLDEFNVDFKVQIRFVYKYRRIFTTIQNDNLVKENITDSKSYFSFFSYMAKRGFYSYDKVFIDEVEDQTYQLISKPKYDRNIEIQKFDKEIDPVIKSKYPLSSGINLIETAKEFPDHFELFNILDFL
ncbi:hypothetical protein [Pedobacter sandarakinus]|uniref:hypothetical protein n=1 Tax=Pedobacter sandarakinus TaxID=353156 RepID=UPI0022454773|nr:hypothetical protein [Pedobacter sandarakinus]MCX2573653.1 hypothetical protein [Pedobacter sandarakinus]